VAELACFVPHCWETEVDYIVRETARILAKWRAPPPAQRPLFFEVPNIGDWPDDPEDVA
jgi:hypothetical protein